MKGTPPSFSENENYNQDLIRQMDDHVHLQGLKKRMWLVPVHLLISY